MTFPPDGMVYLCRGLKERGHEVRVFHTTPDMLKESTIVTPPGQWDGFDVCYTRWDYLELDSLYDFDPDVVVMWNGSAPWSKDSTEVIRSLFKTVHLEFGWIPQKDHYYIANDLAPHASFIMDVPEDYPINEAAIKALRELYKPRYVDLSLPEKFILFPAQLDSDSSILRSSPYYKSSEVFLNDLREYVKNVPIVIKIHPFDRCRKWPEGTHLYDGVLSAMELVSQASVVIGINSTVLAEALVHNKPVFSYGYNVAMRSHISGLSYSDKKEFFEYAEHVCLGGEYTPPHNPEQTLSWLLTKQWPYNAPTDGVFEYVESFNKNGGSNANI